MIQPCPVCNCFMIGGICKICPPVEKQKKVYRIRPMSKKKHKANKDKMKTYDKIGEQHYCWSCGRTDRPLSRSHILPVGQYPQFEAVEENIVIDCYGSSDSCHSIWENAPFKDKMKLGNFEHRVSVILKLAPAYLNIIMKDKHTI